MLTLVIGDKQLSSWSLRPWILLRHLDLPFREVPLKLDTPAFGPAVRRYSAAGRVPVLVDGDLPVWDSLAIIEYVHEKSGGRAWPADATRRAHARSISAEMHSGFSALRGHWPMKAASTLDVPMPPAGQQDVARIDELWQDCRARYAGTGPWLFGDYSAADAMYAPVVLRFHTYGAKLSDAAAAYVRHVLADAPLREWIAGARAELGQ
ncbi:MAG TPA: glutathione S-transferase family protein [Povalibacter sp.]|uniref:glutathione S-transferase family protein n=1 Tax=Povalibacter sp. TaxID=1962978 RepID=UPI002BBB673F|nr:glutathione S-transferase family protein [Povalibacter sp.]HMN46068.1 glutathione S-transferase family protein [Povalibacter sp.]